MAGGETGRREMWKGREGGKTDERERGNHTSGTEGQCVAGYWGLNKTNQPHKQK